MDFFKGLDDIGEPMKKYKKGEFTGRFRVFNVATPHQGEINFGNLGRARTDFAGNKRNKIPSYIAEYAWWTDGSMVEVVDAHDSYRSEEMD